MAKNASPYSTCCEPPSEPAKLPVATPAKQRTAASMKLIRFIVLSPAFLRAAASARVNIWTDGGMFTSHSRATDNAREVAFVKLDSFSPRDPTLDWL
jgi:hypothetical protein